MFARRKRSRRAPGSVPGPAQWGALGIAIGVGALGALPSVTGGMDPLALLAWLGLVAPAMGFLCGAMGLGLWPYPVAVPGVWMILLTRADLGSPRDLLDPAWGALAVFGLFGIGAGLGSVFPRAGLAGVGGVFLLCAGLSGLGSRGGLGGEEWPGAQASRALDVSPVALCLESAGVDWMRRPAIYEPVGTDRFERRAHGGPLAGLGLLLVGWALAAVGRRRRLRAEASESEFDPRPGEPR